MPYAFQVVLNAVSLRECLAYKSVLDTGKYFDINVASAGLSRFVHCAVAPLADTIFNTRCSFFVACKTSKIQK